MSKKFKRIKNYNVSVKEMENEVLFLRKLIPGGSDHSFGIHVAKMAGMPNSVLLSAENKLKFLQNSHKGINSIKNLDNSDQIKLNFISKEEIIENSIIVSLKSFGINPSISSLLNKGSWVISPQETWGHLREPMIPPSSLSNRV